MAYHSTHGYESVFDLAGSCGKNVGKSETKTDVVWMVEGSADAGQHMVRSS